MRITDISNENGELVYTVELEDDVFVDVKSVGDSATIMDCGDGYNVYNSDGNTFDYNYNEEDVIEFVKHQITDNIREEYVWLNM